MEAGRDGWRSKIGRRRDGSIRLREGRYLEDGWIGGEHQRDRE